LAGRLYPDRYHRGVRRDPLLDREKAEVIGTASPITRCH
jgi:hypothetical protein